MRKYLALTLFILSACASSPTSAPPEFTGSLVELVAIEPGKYSWLGKRWSIAKLKKALIAADANEPITKIHLLEGHSELSLGHAIEVGFLAEAIGAKAFVQSKGKFKAVTVAK